MLSVCISSLVQAGVSICLTVAFLETEVAHALLAFSLYPLEAALFSRVLLKEAIPLGTGVALVVSTLAIALVYVPRALDDSPPEEGSSSVERGSWSLHGDLWGVAAGISLGALLTANRSAAKRAPGSGMVLASAFGAVLCVLFALGFLAIQNEVNLRSANGHFRSDGWMHERAEQRYAHIDSHIDSHNSARSG